MAIGRRQFLIGAGGVSALVLAGGYWRVTRMPEDAIAPWSIDPAPPADVRLDAFRHAILAPNPHNRQPWLIKMDGKDGAIVRCDLDKRLPETDPFDRQITIGFGTFLELARIAAAERGVHMDVEPFPEGEAQPRLDARPVARLTFVKDAGIARDPLFAHIAGRRSNKQAYTSRPVDPRLLATIAEGDGATNDARRIAAMRATIVAAVVTEYRTPPKHRESVDLIRLGHAEIDASPDGIDLDGPMIEAGLLAGVVNRDALADPASSVFRTGLDGLRDSYGSIPALIWVTTPGNARADQIEAGRRYVRANLRATARGLAMHPMSQSLQEYAEVAPHFAAIHRLCGAGAGARVQMLARVGYGAPVGPSPRWPVEKHLVA